jgi:hypothetical protein
MAIYNLEIPYFVIRQTRAPSNDTLFATTGLVVSNAEGALHHDWGAKSLALGGRGKGSILATGLLWEGVDVPDPTPDRPDGGSIHWTFNLMNGGNADSGFIPALNKFSDAFAGALAGKVLDALQANDVGTAIVDFANTIELLGAQEVLNLLTANCDGCVASGPHVFEWTAADLAGMTGATGGIWKDTQNNPGTNSPPGCGSNSIYDVTYGISLNGVALPWSAEEDLGSPLSYGPAVASWGLNRLDCFYIVGTMQHRPYHGIGWADQDDRGGATLTGDPAVAAWGPDRLDLFCRNQDNHMWHMWYDGGWNGWEDRGGILTSSPAVASWGPNRLDCFYRGQNQHLWHRWWDGHAWSGEEDLGGIIDDGSGPTVAARGPNLLDCFYRGLNGHMWHRWFDGNQWSGEEDLGGFLTSSPAVASWGPNRLDCFYRGQNQHLWHRWWDGRLWNEEEDLGGVLTSNPAVTSWGQNRLDVFYRGLNGHMWHRWFPAW